MLDDDHDNGYMDHEHQQIGNQSTGSRNSPCIISVSIAIYVVEPSLAYKLFTCNHRSNAALRRMEVLFYARTAFKGLPKLLQGLR